ncbi:hypothetical protein [Faunimonas pinastri]|nr:hypothetical protein [Faunimonas pinastri]
MKIMASTLAAAVLMGAASFGVGTASAQPVKGQATSHDDPGPMIPHRGYKTMHHRNCHVKTVKSWHHGHPVWKKMRVCR